MRRYRIHCYWVAVCIGIHTFAMDCEAEEKVAATDYDDELGLMMILSLSKGFFQNLSQVMMVVMLQQLIAQVGQLACMLQKAHHEGLNGSYLMQR